MNLHKMQVFGKCTVVALFTLAMVSNSFAQKERFDWMPPESTADGLGASSQGKVFPITFTKIPKKTADKSKFTKRYTLDLKKFGIHNDGTHAAETSKGINAALRWAQKAGKNYILFPKGTYLISTSDPILIRNKNTIIDLNGCTLQTATYTGKRRGYDTVKIMRGAENLRLTNGIIRGDRFTNKGKYLGGRAIDFVSGKNLEVDHLLIRDHTGYTVVSGRSGTENRQQLLASILAHVALKNLTQGGFSKNGQPIADADKTRTIKAYDVTKRGDTEFEFGWTEGYCGYPSVKGRDYQIYFYDKNNLFVKRVEAQQFREVKIPKRAKYAQFEFNQPTVTSTRAHCGRITNSRPSVDVHFHHNHMLNNRGMGQAFCGGQRWIIEHNIYENNGPLAPGYGLDLEDGWELMQDVVIRYNKFYGNKRGSLVICAGQQVHVEGNEFASNVLFWARPYNYVFKNNKVTGGLVRFGTRTGVARIEGNSYKNIKSLSVMFDQKAVASGIYRKDGENVSTPPIALRNETIENVPKITGTYLKIHDSKIKGSRFLVDNETGLVQFEKNQFDSSSINYKAGKKPVIVIEKKNQGSLVESGAGVTRKQPLR